MKAEELHPENEKGGVVPDSPPTEVGSPPTVVNSPSVAFNTLRKEENEGQKLQDSLNIDQHEHSLSNIKHEDPMSDDQYSHLLSDAKNGSNQQNHPFSEGKDASDTSSSLSESNWTDADDNLSELFNDPHHYRLTPPAGRTIMSQPDLTDPFNILDQHVTSPSKVDSPSVPPKPKFDEGRDIITGNVLWWDNLIGKGMIQEQKTSQVRTITWQDILPHYAGLSDSALVQYHWSDYGRFEKFWVMDEGAAVL